ncbi:MAG TPA: hypothetical protein VJM51_05215 [Dehalococcoidia bacterium]|nr:hypothetical protein [Dehalococcoidia bacterium]
MSPDPLHTAILEALARVPETHLVIYDLARELTGPDGQVDVERAAERTEEIRDALVQAEAYVTGNQEVLNVLYQLMREGG